MVQKQSRTNSANGMDGIDSDLCRLYHDGPDRCGIIGQPSVEDQGISSSILSLFAGWSLLRFHWGCCCSPHPVSPSGRWQARRNSGWILPSSDPGFEHEPGWPRPAVRLKSPVVSGKSPWVKARQQWFAAHPRNRLEYARQDRYAAPPLERPSRQQNS